MVWQHLSVHFNSVYKGSTLNLLPYEVLSLIFRLLQTGVALIFREAYIKEPLHSFPILILHFDESNFWILHESRHGMV